ncbi:MAG TPA: nitrite/sulfite reductase [Acidimicrobiales bacterium]|nr:nitrite/sulfite reductase [Acidimicrobiales bacterium]
MAAPDIPGIKRAGLPVDLERLAREGDGWLTPEDRYALKTRGICTQLQDGVFMVRVRIPGGVLPTEQARHLARLSRSYGSDWLHLTTRQNIELHWIEPHQIPRLFDGLTAAGLSTDSACGHTLRNIMCSEEAGVALDEPFDCFPDAKLVSDAIVARSRQLNCELPSRINIAFGGSARCRDDAKINDAAFVSVLGEATGEPGYELYAGGSLGKAPRLAILLTPFLPRHDVMAAAEALVEVFVAHGDFDHPARGRMKFCIEALGEDGFRAAWEQAFAAARCRPQPATPPIEVLAEVDKAAILASRPVGGWSAGIRPQRTRGLVSVVVDVPLGDTRGAELELLADLADRHGDGHLVLGRDQDVVLRNIDVAAVPQIRAALVERGLHPVGEAHVARVRACTGSAVCALGISPAPQTGWDLIPTPGLGRNSSLRVHVSGCPNSCAQHQVGDLGLAGTKVRLGGETRLGYQLFLGADVERGLLGEVVGRLAAEDAGAAIDAVVGAWEATRQNGESLGATVRRFGLDAFAAHLEAQLAERWASGAEAEIGEVVIPSDVVPA